MPRKFAQLPPEQEAAFVAAVKSRMAIQDLAAKFAPNNNHKHISRWARERGLEIWSDKVRARIVAQMWFTQASREDIAAAIGKNTQTVQRIRKSLGLPNRAIDGQQPWRPDEDAYLLRKREQNIAHASLAATWPSHFPARSEQAISARLRQIAPKTAKSGWVKGRKIAAAIVPKITECLIKHGPSPAWRLRDYAESTPILVETAIKKMVKEGRVRRTGGLVELINPQE